MKHSTSPIQIDGNMVEIDNAILPLVETLNKFGIKTTHSCQGEKRGYIAIDIDNVEAWIGEVNGQRQVQFSLRFPAYRVNK